MILASGFPLPVYEIDEVDRRLQAHVRGRVADRQDAEDIAQEAWARMAASSGRDHGAIENVRGYLFRVARNLVIAHRRRAAAMVEVKAYEAVMKRVADGRPDPEGVLITRCELRSMDQIMAAMPARSREVFRLSRIEGLPFAEIGRKLGTSRQTVHEHMYAFRIWGSAGPSRGRPTGSLRRVSNPQKRRGWPDGRAVSSR